MVWGEEMYVCIQVFRSETDKLDQLVWEVILSEKISYKPWVHSASFSGYGPKCLFALVIVLSTRTPITIVMTNEQSGAAFFVSCLPTGGEENTGIQCSYYLSYF
jgi:hypothetical protein